MKALRWKVLVVSRCLWSSLSDEKLSRSVLLQQLEIWHHKPFPKDSVIRLVQTSPTLPQLVHLLQLASWDLRGPAFKSSIGPTTGLPAASIWGLWVPSLCGVQSHLHSAAKHRSSIAVHAATLQGIRLSNEGWRQRPKLENEMKTEA